MLKNRKAKPLPAKPRPDEMPRSAPAEADVLLPSESPAQQPFSEPLCCGIDGCTTRYDDEKIMHRHKERVHGIGGQPNLNQPLPRHGPLI